VASGVEPGGTGAVAAPAPPRLSPADIEDLLAFGEVLVSGGPRLPARDRPPLLEHVEQRLQQGGGYYAELYHQTVDVLTRLGGGRFATLSDVERVSLIMRHRLALAQVQPDESLTEDVRAVRTRAAPDLIGSYYASEAGWATVGYGVFPGRCGDLTRYTRSEA
jgi:hypothetical protein